ncbi:acyl-CoA dehydrogenase family protein [Tropicimonas isoalkanivorans]|uniref:Acyl-CoA dehydrogenase n=1 Tax=Tropicimonas isoalkanivorans TaxID=441112 RepID=A0A1I1HZ89_9RHOB|nr:acyl-CoA dehydrogenase family protein [Tropicimonas isoalkanivorans]SFC29244.1 hypothetical protein SAMN04488094_103338 [Tropicimonas isoalkanivorans]
MFEEASPDLTDEQRMILDGANRFVTEICPFEKRREATKAGVTLDRTVWGQMAELGWFGLGLSEEAGGFGGTLEDVALIAETLGRGQVLEPFTMCAVFPARLLVGIGGQTDLIEKIVSGEKLVAVAHSEPDARGDVTRIAVTASPEGGGFRLDGLKSLVVGGDHADVLLVTARLPDGSLGLFRLARHSESVTTEGTRLADWTSGLDLRFTSAIAERIASGDAMAHALAAARDEAVTMLCAECVGAMDGTIQVTAPYISERRQFGVPLSSFQALQHRMADMAADLTIARSAVLRALSFLGAPSAERAAQVAGCKALVQRLGRWTTQQGIQLHGGYGITEEYQVGQYHKRLLVTDAMFGSRDVNLSRYTGHMLSRMMEAAQ